MNAPEVLIRLAKTGDLEAIRQLLSNCQLPTSDLSKGKLECFFVAIQEGKVLGVSGLERSGDEALLRSVAVLPSERGTGLGKRLVFACRELAKAWGLQAIYLIPNDADAHAFFLHLGCTEVSRAVVPEALRILSEFTHLCPQTHPCLRMALSTFQANGPEGYER
ncbi:hypothetical protein AT959_02200 [Dechloromonas denitrificans]|uniref:N-acetyltransferase domain-containing protein n=1 Tax=Dechloromonas denitrificans TaxID=281362 RepID=A0A133XNK6_9RHOO|nr:GNAT family N-acetyltransferase [Dechloromonas denitrificans]KXB32518.1 hypothetical protein AT959_02200 [Dechloromonas denitrificans]